MPSSQPVCAGTVLVHPVAGGGGTATAADLILPLFLTEAQSTPVACRRLP